MKCASKYQNDYVDYINCNASSTLLTLSIASECGPGGYGGVHYMQFRVSRGGEWRGNLALRANLWSNFKARPASAS